MKSVSLFRSRPIRSRMTIMVAGSVLVHMCLVQLGATMCQPTADLRVNEYAPVDFFNPPPPGPPEPPVSGNPEPTPLVVSVTPPPVVNPPDAVVTPPPMESPDMTEPTPVPKPHPAVARASHATATTAVSRPAAASPGVPNGGTLASGTVGVAGSGATLGWKTPRPPYPRTALMARAQGTTTVRFTTDALGNVASVVIVRSTGNAALDAATLSYVRNNWKGPANSARTTEFVYQLP